MIYVPDINYACYVVQSEGVIRAYEQIPNYNSTINYRDYYINSNYIYRDSYTSFGSYSTLPTCLSNDNLTTDYWYRNDFDKILIILIIMFFFIVIIPVKILKRFFRRFQ